MLELQSVRRSLGGPEAGSLCFAQPSVHQPQLHELSTDEIDLVSGGVGPAGAALGAGLGAVSWAVGGGGSWASLGAQMLGGAMAGGFGGVSAIGAVWGFNGAMVGGIGQGAFGGGWGGSSRVKVVMK